MKWLSILFLTGLLAGCSIFQGTPHPPPALTNYPQEIRHDQTKGLTKIARVTALVRGSPMDSEVVIKQKAIAAKADYYLILLNTEHVVAGQWYAQAILYRR